MGRAISYDGSEEQSPQCIHVIGVGKSGADMISEMIYRGEIEDLLDDKRARFTALAIDIGDKDLKQVNKAGNALKQRLADRDIPSDRVQVRTYGIEPPKTEEEKDDFFASMERVREYMKVEYPQMYWNPNYEPWVNEEFEIPEPGDHIDRGMAKALYYDNYYNGALKKEVDDFVKSVLDTKLPSIVYIFFGAGGGTGSGIVVDLARHVANVGFGRRMTVCGFTFLPTDLDEECHKGPGVYVALSELETQINKEANDGVMAVWGELTRNPWTGGLYAIPRDTVAIRTQGNVEVENLNESVLEHRTNATVQCVNRNVDAFLSDFLCADYGRRFTKSARITGQLTHMWIHNDSLERSWNVILPFQEIHPCVAVMPTNHSKLVQDEAIHYLENFKNINGLNPEFKTDFISAYNFMPRTVYTEKVKNALEKAIKSTLIDEGNYTLYEGEAFDEVNCYTLMLIPGVALRDFKCFYEARAKYDALEEWEDRFKLHSFLVDMGPMICEPSIRTKGMAGECIWGCACFIAYPYDKLRGDSSKPPYRPEIWAAATAALNATIAPTPDITVLQK